MHSKVLLLSSQPWLYEATLKRDNERVRHNLLIMCSNSKSIVMLVEPLYAPLCLMHKPSGSLVMYPNSLYMDYFFLSVKHYQIHASRNVALHDFCLKIVLQHSQPRLCFFLSCIKMKSRLRNDNELFLLPFIPLATSVVAFWSTNQSHFATHKNKFLQQEDLSLYNGLVLCSTAVHSNYDAHAQSPVNLGGNQCTSSCDDRWVR